MCTNILVESLVLQQEGKSIDFKIQEYYNAKSLFDSVHDELMSMFDRGIYEKMQIININHLLQTHTMSQYPQTSFSLNIPSNDATYPLINTFIDFCTSVIISNSLSCYLFRM